MGGTHQPLTTEWPQTPDSYWVGMLICFLLEDFWGIVWRSTQEHVQILPSHEYAAQAKVNEFDVSSGIRQDVVQLQVSVHNALLLAVAHGTCDLSEYSLGLLLLHATGLQDVVL